MQQLEVRRLSAKESAEEQCKDYDRVPVRARLKWVCRYLGKSDRTVAKYRKLLFANCLTYQTLTCMNGLDNPILLREQIELLSQFSKLMDLWKSESVAIEFYNKHHPSPLE